MKTFLIWILVLVESGFANLNFVPSGIDGRSLNKCERASCDPDVSIAAFIGLFRLKNFKHSNLLSTASLQQSRRFACSQRISASQERSLDSNPSTQRPASGMRRGLSLDWVSESKRSPSFTSRPSQNSVSQRPGFAVPSSWREGVQYEFGAAHTFTRGEPVAVLFSDGSLRFGRVERTPREAEGNAEYIVQVLAALHHFSFCC
jgi:hypothetical protein